jgi:DNA-3-methyladenine glycosylase I
MKHFSQSSRELHQTYHDNECGFPIHHDDELFGRLILEINQAGLSWETILKKQDNFRKAYSDFCIAKIAAYEEHDRVRLMNDAGIIRNRLKINAAIENAKTILIIQKEHGSFERWIEHHHPLTKEEWVKIFKKTFKFTGGEIVNEFLTSIGVLPHAHDESCPIYEKTLKANPLWLKYPCSTHRES